MSNAYYHYQSHNLPARPYAKPYPYEQETGSHDSDSTCEDKTSYEGKVRHKVKVELCKNFLQSRECPYKGKCKFAHGLEELLRNSDLGQNFRTKRCKVFYDKKYCKFGQRCNFKHGSQGVQTEVPCARLKVLREYPEVVLATRGRSKILDMLQADARVLD